MKQVLLIDVMNLAYRVHYATPDLATKKGQPTSVLHGFMSYVLYLNYKFPDTPMIFCFDAGRTWRHEYSDKKYKSNRQPSESHTKIYSQIEHLFALLLCFGFHALMIQGTEADDIIGVLAYQFIKKHKKLKVLIYSGDRDYFQLINDRVFVIKAQGGTHLQKFDEEAFEKEYGILPKQWVKLRALSGDSSDKIKPVKGIGRKTALKMVQTGIDASLKKFKYHPHKVQKIHAAKLKEHWNKIHDAYILSKLPKSHKFKMFSKEIAERVKWWTHHVVKNPRRRKMTKEQYKSLQKNFLKLAEKFELDSLLARRHDFLKIP